MPKPRQYYVLLERTEGQWCLAFGDYERETVDYEFEDYIDHGVKRKNLKIITTQAKQAAIDAAIAALNAKEV